MSTDAIDAEHRPLAVRGEAVDETAPRENLALFGTSDPVDVIARATRVADALKAMIVKKKLVANIQGKEYPQVEAWQTLAVMLGLATVCEWSRPVDDGWEARVIVQRNGVTIAAAEAQCLKTERSKRSWEDYAIRSMAQTRATSKSLRSVLGFVMTLAGYEATPAEEMPSDAPKGGFGDNFKPGTKVTVTPPAESPADLEARMAKGRSNIGAYCREHGITDERRYRLTAALVYGDTVKKDAKLDELKEKYSLTKLTLPQIQHVSRIVQEYKKSDIKNEDDDSFRSWCAYMKDLEAGA